MNQDRLVLTSGCFFFGTCNDVSRLPPEFSRAERSDGVSFLGLPTAAEKDGIWALYRHPFGIPEGQARPDDTSRAGAAGGGGPAAGARGDAAAPA